MDEHVIYIRAVEGGFSLTVEPPHPDHPPMLFLDHRSARGRSGGLRMVTGWRRIDLAEPEEGR